MPTIRDVSRQEQSVPIEYQDTKDHLRQLARAVNRSISHRALHPTDTPTTISSTYTMVDSDSLLLCKADNPITIYLLTAAGREGRLLTVKKIDGGVNVVVIDAKGTETIDGALTQTLTAQYSFMTVKSDNTNWWSVAQRADVGGGAYTDEQAQDSVGLILADTGTIDFTYDDATPQISGIVKLGSIMETHLSLTDTTAFNVSTSMHGFAPKAPNDATKYLDGTGAYSVPAGSGSGLSVIASTEHTGNGTHSLNASTVLLYVEVIGGGGSAGSGAAGTNATNRSGGGGGSAGAVAAAWFRASDITSPVSVTVGGSVSGPAGVTGTSNGTGGTAGNPSSFGAYLAAAGGNAGAAGLSSGAAPGTAFARNSPLWGAMNGQAYTTPFASPGFGTGSAGAPLGTAGSGGKGGTPFGYGGPGGGAQGALITTAGGVTAGQLGGAAFGSAGKGMFQQTTTDRGEGGGTVGPVSSATAAIAASDATFPFFGDGGPSGGSSATTNAGDGAAGAAPGGGGGGGGSCRNTNTSGAGGGGARGAVRVIEYG